MSEVLEEKQFAPEVLKAKLGNWFRVPRDLFEREKDLNARAKIVFVALVFHVNDHKDDLIVFPSYDRLQAFTGLRRAAIAKALKDLEKRGWLTRCKRFGKSTKYELCSPHR